MPDFPVPTTCPILPAKDFLRRHAGISLTLWRKIKNGGTLMINSRAGAANDLVYPGDVITVTWPENSSIIAEQMPLSIVYEDEWLLAIDKPAGMLIHPSSGHCLGTLANAVMHYYRQQNYTSLGFHPVNRLDRNTSGLVLIAKRPDIQHRLNLNHHQIIKSYRAIASAAPLCNQGTINAPIARKAGSIIEREVHYDGRQAITNYRVICANNKDCLLELTLVTGRTHQIRVHLSHIGCPLHGDDLYGGSTVFISRQALHAARLQLPHPITTRDITISSPIPKDMAELLMQLGLQTTNML